MLPGLQRPAPHTILDSVNCTLTGAQLYYADGSGSHIMPVLLGQLSGGPWSFAMDVTNLQQQQQLVQKLEQQGGLRHSQKAAVVSMCCLHAASSGGC